MIGQYVKVTLDNGEVIQGIVTAISWEWISVGHTAFSIWTVKEFEWTSQQLKRLPSEQVSEAAPL